MLGSKQTVDNAMACHRTGYDRHGIHVLYVNGEPGSSPLLFRSSICTFLGSHRPGAAVQLTPTLPSFLPRMPAHAVSSLSTPQSAHIAFSDVVTFSRCSSRDEVLGVGLCSKI